MTEGEKNALHFERMEALLVFETMQGIVQAAQSCRDKMHRKDDNGLCSRCPLEGPRFSRIFFLTMDKLRATERAAERKLRKGTG